MIGRKTALVGLALVCAACLFAASVASASAAESTWATCTKETTPKSYSDATCKTTTGTLEYGTKAVPADTTTEVEPKITSSVLTFASTNAGVRFKIGCTGLTGSGKVLNTAGPPMTATASAIVWTFSGCTVEEPAGKGCVVEAGGTSGKIVFDAVKASGTMPMSTENQVKYVPEAGTSEPFTTIKVSGCTSTILNGGRKTTGSLTAISSETTGMTLQTFTSTSSALEFGGQAATFLGEIDLLMKGTTNRIGLGTF